MVRWINKRTLRYILRKLRISSCFSILSVTWLLSIFYRLLWHQGRQRFLQNDCLSWFLFLRPRWFTDGAAWLSRPLEGTIMVFMNRWDSYQDYVKCLLGQDNQDNDCDGKGKYRHKRGVVGLPAIKVQRESDWEGPASGGSVQSFAYLLLIIQY